MDSSRSQMHLFWWLLLGLTASFATVSGQTIVRIAEAREPFSVDYTGQIRRFSEIGPGGPITNTPRPWVCYTDFNLVNNPIAVVQWQTPSGSVVPSGSGQAIDSQFYTIAIPQGLALVLGPDYNSPDGEYCCEIPTVSGQRRCVTLTTCPMLPFPANGRITYDPNTNVATYSCDQAGYGPTIPQRICESNDHWSMNETTVTCERIMCPTLSSPENGQVMVNTHTVGGVATYTCNNGYTLTGASMRMCEEDSGVIGQWSPEELTCPLLCPRETPSNGRVTYSPDSDPLLPGAVGGYSCVTGYDLTGDETRTCVMGTGWTGSLPVCNIIDCGALTRPPNGQVDTSSGTTYNQVATYSCDTGYNLVGSSTRTCQANGMWSSTAPVCEFIPLSIRGRILTNNVMLAITDIGEGASALTCHTELTTCCREQDNPSGGALGEWTGPDSNQIPESNSTLGFYVSRQRSSISLNRGGNSTVGGQYCCVIPRTGEEMTFCVNVQVVPTTRPTTLDGCTVTLAVTLPLAATVIVAMATILIIIAKQLKDARTQLGALLEPQTNQVYDTPALTYYEDVSKTDVGGASDHTYTPAMELSQCPAYAPTEVSTGRGGRGDVGEEVIYDN